MHTTGNTLVVNMILHCPACGLQHIDAPDRMHFIPGTAKEWDNPPHRSHLCHGCGHIWRPSDVHTNGVERITSKGVNDSAPVAPVRQIHWRADWKPPQ